MKRSPAPFFVVKKRTLRKNAIAIVNKMLNIE
ncbi:hypothetical protein AF60_00120 [Streptococcus uberis S6261]|nr:hypothetical protein AF61_02500 [Streptococcus uberis EF20/0145]KKF51436.1 hypothetical protein AF60_00120 [Streptococcus uberis S6261]